jgi:hypothetical protein
MFDTQCLTLEFVQGQRCLACMERISLLLNECYLFTMQSPFRSVYSVMVHIYIYLCVCVCMYVFF